MAASFQEVCKEFSLTAEQMEHQDAGRFIVEKIHNIQTAYNIRQGMADKVDFTKQNQPLPVTEEK